MVIDRIKAGKYTGYIWKSSEPLPEVLEEVTKSEITFDTSINPFTIEAKLFDKESGDSYSVKFIDGQYFITVENVNNLNKKYTKSEKKVFVGNKMKDNNLVFIQYYAPVSDPLCEGMEVLKEAECVFVGFQK